MYYVTGLLNHLKAIQAYATKADAQALMDARDLSLEVRAGSESRRFQPQFFERRDGRRFYTPTFSANVTAFIGWRPDAARGWPTSVDKLLFKERAQAVGVRVPEVWREPSDAVRHFIIKRSRSSFGDGIRGPFQRVDPDSPHHRLAEGEYYEAFVPGRIAKAWYLEGALLCLELRPPPFVTGDGRSTLLELAAARLSDTVDQQPLSWIVAAQGRRLSDVVESGKSVVVDFKYGSSYDIWRFDNENVLSTVRDTSVGAQLREAGPLLLSAIPPENRDTLITLDAVVDAKNQVWFLEMNSNPAVHPDVYPAMMESAFRPRSIPPPVEMARLNS
jgi:hypothetical protein